MELISGIQQIGIGVPDMLSARKFYRDTFGMAVQVFDDEAQAKLMTRYTNGKVETRRASLTLNMAGGGGMEIWQYISKTPVFPIEPICLGDTGIFAARIKSSDVNRAHKRLAELNPTPIIQNPEGSPVFYIQDPWKNWFIVTQGHDWFSKIPLFTGGVYGGIIGVSDMEKSLKLYKDIFGVNHIVYDIVETPQEKVPILSGKFRRVLLRKYANGKGSFGPLLGGIEIELVQALETKPREIFNDRCWGDAGFIHLCFDTLCMKELKVKCEEAGFPFTVDSGDTFEMGDSGGRFAYIEDPDGTWVEMVETHKIPIIKKLGFYLNLKKKNPEKPLPRWILKLLGISKVKN